MILVIVGMSPIPFDRLIVEMDKIAAELGENVLIQTGSSKHELRNAESVKFLDMDELDRAMSSSDLVVSHCGMGTVLDARRWKKPIVVLPRDKDHAEALDNHQKHTAESLKGMNGIFVADSELELRGLVARAKVYRMRDDEELPEKNKLISFLRNLIDDR